MVFGLLVLTGCAYRMQVEPPSQEHPANPGGPEASHVMPPVFLRPDDQDKLHTPNPESVPPRTPGHHPPAMEHHEDASDEEAKP